jgi:hypothetical protein
MEDVPLIQQILCVVLTGLFVLCFNVARDPRKWRRFYQAHFNKPEEISVNRNKAMDESLRKYGILVAMALLLADVGVFVSMLTRSTRIKAAQMSQEAWQRLDEHKRIESRAPTKANSGLR